MASGSPHAHSLVVAPAALVEALTTAAASFTNGVVVPTCASGLRSARPEVRVGPAGLTGPRGERPPPHTAGHARVLAPPDSARRFKCAVSGIACRDARRLPRHFPGTPPFRLPPFPWPRLAVATLALPTACDGDRSETGCQRGRTVWHSLIHSGNQTGVRRITPRGDAQGHGDREADGHAPDTRRLERRCTETGRAVFRITRRLHPPLCPPLAPARHWGPPRHLRGR